MNWLEKRILKNVIYKTCTQGGHEDRLIALYKQIAEEARKSFNEDNNVTLRDFLDECYDKATTDAICKSLPDPMIQKMQKDVDILFARPEMEQAAEWKHRFVQMATKCGIVLGLNNGERAWVREAGYECPDEGK